jgi:hypothetical protein
VIVIVVSLDPNLLQMAIWIRALCVETHHKSGFESPNQSSKPGMIKHVRAEPPEAKKQTQISTQRFINAPS